MNEPRSSEAEKGKGNLARTGFICTFAADPRINPVDRFVMIATTRKNAKPFVLDCLPRQHEPPLSGAAPEQLS
ncbi:hypothetical protein HQ37_06930 [Porphyromonas sp. COT-239 OH1446]|nr:hypothetical protein HQ37_06930 [Porphyromonas sp. COT-239 OH1446]